MDGEGSLARSILRSLRPQADLKAAAIGAVVLLREWLQQKRQNKTQDKIQDKVGQRRGRAKGKARAVPERERPPRVIALVERILPRRFGISLTVILLAGATGLGIVKGGHLQDFVTAVSDARNAMANSVGFRITSVVINGRKQLTQDEILAIGGVSGRSSLLFLDAEGVRDKLKANSWIAEATVLKLYPGQLQIDITERKPFALWQEAGRLSVIADDGAVLEPYVSRRFLSLPLVVGKGADTRSRDFLALLARYPQVQSVTKAAIFVGERRWNLRLRDGLDIRLPEQDVGNALAALSRLDKDEKLFSKDIVAVDMRLPDRLVVQLSDDAAKAREEQFKDKKSKKKTGDSA
jgi:cell division protein FtsQ